ncbi:MAG TPA: BTAD domain-containing putative transcriptional regulator [Candidatus Dormibacteraeota bacterium]|nr:BTAD domain-containing putative transcriptional regulator [Candidatus Dormibacteraeota bacterium]
MKVSVLGALHIQGVDKHALGSRKARTLIKVLAVARGQPVPVPRLIDCLWPDRPPARPSQQISVLVSRLRAVLGPERIPRSDAGYQLIADWIDLDIANHLATAASRRLVAQNYASARLAAEAALALMRGELLADEPDSPWADEERAAVARLAVDVRRTAARAALAVGDYGAARDMSEAVVAADTYDEAALQVLMAALAHGGQPGTALATFARARKRLREDLGVDPSPATDAVHKAILQGKPIPGLVIGVAAKSGRAPRAHVAPAHVASTEGLAGRADDLAALDHALKEVARGGVKIVVVDGVSGIGKTRLVTHWAASARASETTVLQVACAGLDRTVPLHPLVAALDQFVESDRRRAQVLGPHPGYRTLLDASRSDPAPAVIAPALNARVRSRMFEVMLETFRQIAASAPAALVLDDIHLAGELTAAWLDFARTRPAGVALLIVVTQHPNGRLPNRVDRRITLGPLDVAAAGTIVGASRAAELHALTGGNPLFLVQLAGNDQRSGLPATIRQAVDARSEQLGAAAHTLRTAATIGPVLDPDLLMEILGLHPADLFAHLESGVRALFLDEGQGAFTFHHEQVREALAAGLTSPWRAHVHRTAARLLESRQAPDPVQVAQHARLGGDVTQAVSTLQVAARTCVRRRDYAEAERLLTDALELEDNADSRLQRAEVRILIGQFARAAEDARAAMVRGAGAAGMEIAAWCSYYLGDFAYALTLAEEGAALAESPGVRARCLVVAGRLLHADGHLEAADLRYSEARRLADESGLTTLAAVWLAALRCDQGRARDALELLRLPPSGVDDSEQPLTARHRHLARARALMMLGQVSDALEALDSVSAEDGRAELSEGGPDGANLRAAILVAIGQLEAADEINLKELGNARAAHMRPLLEVSLIGLGESRLVAGARRSASRYLGEAVRARVGPYPFRWLHRGRSRLLHGRLELAGGSFGRAVVAARELLAEATRSGDVVHAVAARLLEAEALAASGAAIDTQAVGAMLKSSTEVLGADTWRLTARFAQLTGNTEWRALAKRQLDQLLSASGDHAGDVRKFAESFQERLGRP